MTASGYKRLMILSFIAAVGFLGLAWHLALRNAVQKADEMATWTTIANFDRARDFALHSEPRLASELLYQVAYLPPPRTNTGPLDMIVEQERKRAIGEIIEYLRKRTGDNLGDQADKWINKYSENEKKGP